MSYRDVGYARLSHADPDEAGAIARQKADIRRVSAATGGELVGPILVDNAVSASRYARRKRKEYPKLLELARAGAVDRAVIYDLDRLLRIPRELEDLIDLVEAKGGTFAVVGVNGVMDLSTGDGRYFARMRVAQAAKESDDTSRRLRSMFAQHATQGRPKGGKGRARAFGYDTDGLTVLADEAALIRDAAVSVLAGEPVNAVARTWNAAGYRTPRLGALWSNRTVRSVLVGHRIAGLRVHRLGERDEATFDAVWPGIIDEATHRALLRRLVEQPARLPGRRTEYTGLFAAVVDGECWPMRRDRDRSRTVYRTYRRHPGTPHPSVTIGPASELEALVAETLFRAVESGDVARRVARRRDTRPVGEDPGTVRAALEQAAEDEAAGLMTRGEWLAKRRPLQARLKVALAAEAAADDSHVLVDVDPEIRARWTLPPEQGGYTTDRRRAILRAVFDRVEIIPAARLGPGLDPARVTPIWRD